MRLRNSDLLIEHCRALGSLCKLTRISATGQYPPGPAGGRQAAAGPTTITSESNEGKEGQSKEGSPIKELPEGSAIVAGRPMGCEALEDDKQRHGAS